MDDPYVTLEGLYHCQVVNLVAASDHYDTDALLCWIIQLDCYGSIDTEHGDILTFPGVRWTDIVKRPQHYLDAQWKGEDGPGTHVLPWLHFPFVVEKEASEPIVLKPYGKKCLLHNTKIRIGKLNKHPVYENVMSSESESWLENRHHFPCAGLHVSEKKYAYCPECHKAEAQWVLSFEQWVQEYEEEIQQQKSQNKRRFMSFFNPPELTPNAHGYVKCPICNWRFNVTDPKAYHKGRHTKCGSRLVIRDPASD